MTNETHYQMAYEEAKAWAINKWVDPEDFKQHPWMLCRTGDGHAQGTRNKRAVTCPRCIEKLAKPEFDRINHGPFEHPVSE